MKEYLIGTGGWAYFRIPGMNSLVAYSRAFNFVEVNSTFYRIPKLEEVEKWRRLVPLDFQFSVRAHKSITHTYRLSPVEATFEVFDKMKHICDILKADLLHFETPASYKFDDQSVERFRQFLSSLNLGSLRLALETRHKPTQKLTPELLKTMRDNNIIHCVDLSKGEVPAYNSDVLYARLFGKGSHNIYQPTDDELSEIDNAALNLKSERIVMSFHFVRMYKDAARLKIYKETGKFPRITRSTGLSSLEEVLREDTVFPVTKQDLIDKQGWKLFDETETKRIHVGEYLRKLPEVTFESIEDLTRMLVKTIG